MYKSSVFVAVLGVVQFLLGFKILIDPPVFFKLFQISWTHNENNHNDHEWLCVTFVSILLISYGMLESILGILGNRQFTWVSCAQKMLVVSMFGAASMSEVFQRYQAGLYLIIGWGFVTTTITIILVSLELPMQLEDPEPNLDEQGNPITDKTETTSSSFPSSSASSSSDDSVSSLPTPTAFGTTPTRAPRRSSRNTTPMKESPGAVDTQEGIHLRSGKHVPSNANLLRKTD